MKFTWGHAITISFILFAGYILYFVVRSFNTEVDLVSEDYYAREVAFQDQIDATKKGDGVANNITIQTAASGVMLLFPTDPTIEIEEGQVVFFRPSQDDLDRSFPLSLDPDQQMFFPSQLLTPGRYEVQLTWVSGGERYYVSKDIVI